MKAFTKRRLDSWALITIILLLLYLVFMVYPVGNLLIQSVIDKATQTFSLDSFIKFFSKPYYLSTLFNSFKVSISATLLALLVGTPLAYFFTAYRIKGAKVLRILIIIASMSAPFIGAYSWILLLGRNGVLTQLIYSISGIMPPDIYGFTGILLVFTLQLFPLIFLYASGALKNVDHSLMEASENMGCIGIKRFVKVVLPLITPSLLAGALLVFMRALADFGTPMLIGEGYRTFPVLIFNEFLSEVGGDDSFAAAIAVVAILITTAVFLVQKIIARKKSFTMNALHPMTPKELKGIKKVFVYLFSYGVVGLAVMPQCYVIYTSFINTKGMVFQSGYSLDSYISAFETLGNSIQNTILIPGISLVIIILMAVLIAYLSVRRRNAATSLLDILSMIPYIVPGTVAGIALLSAFNSGIFGSGVLAISATMSIMVVALVIRRLPYTIRSSVAILSQIPISIEEAALSLGASKMKTFFKITIPMMASGIISGAILSWVTMISELSTAILLSTYKTQTLSVATYTEVIRGNYGVAAALSTILTVLTVISLLIFMKLSKGEDLSI